MTNEIIIYLNDRGYVDMSMRDGNEIFILIFYIFFRLLYTLQQGIDAKKLWKFSSKMEEISTLKM